MQLKYILITAGLAMGLGACKKDFVDLTPQGQFLSQNYYANEEQAYSALVAVYDVVRKNSGGFENMLALMNSGSDDHVAGGGSATDGVQIQSFSNYTMTANIMAGSYWNDYYQGIMRANTLLKKLPDVPMDGGRKTRFEAEAKALRGYYYFNLVRMFRNIPLLLEPLTASQIYDVEQVSPDEVYAQIEKDLQFAVGALPGTVAGSEAGRLSKGAAMALLGKVYLYEKKNGPAAQQLAELNGPVPGAASPLGYKLLTNFRDLWVVSNKFNTESIFEETHSAGGNSNWDFWGSGRDEGNTYNVMVGPRSYSRPATTSAPALPSGWSFNVFTDNFYDFIKTDPRFEATVFDLKALKAAGQADYIPGNENSGYFLNKFLPRTADVSTGGGATELNYRQNTYIIRLADTYLMEAEALGATGTRAQALLDAVRARVGLPSVPVSLAAIKRERRAELAGEGHRWFDLVRWGDAPTVLAGRGFVAGKHEIFPIPFRELQGTKLKQNPKYD